ACRGLFDFVVCGVFLILPDGVHLGMVDIANFRKHYLLLGWATLSDGRSLGATWSSAWDDAADWLSDHGGIRCFMGRDAWYFGCPTQFLVGTCLTGDHHAVGSLDRDAFPSANDFCFRLPSCAVTR